MTDPLWPPSTQTMFHWQFDPYRSVFEEICSQYPKKKEDEANLKLVQETNTLEELIDLIPRVKGHSLLKLENKLAEFCGRNIEGIKTIIQNFESSEDGFQKEVLLTVLGLIGKKEGLPIYDLLMDLFDRLSGYYKSLVAVLLGWLGDDRAAEPLWNYLQEVKGTSEEVNGALWGLVELNDKRVNEYLRQVFSGPEKNFSYELFPFTAKVGDKRVVGQLFRLITISKSMEIRDAALHALAYIVKREGTGVIMNYLRSGNRRVKSLAREIVSLSKEPDDSFYILQMFDPIGTLPPLVKIGFSEENNTTSSSETR